MLLNDSGPELKSSRSDPGCLEVTAVGRGGGSQY